MIIMKISKFYKNMLQHCFPLNIFWRIITFYALLMADTNKFDINDIFSGNNGFTHYCFYKLLLTAICIYWLINISIIVSVVTDWNLVGWLVVFYVPSTARSFRDGTPIYCPLRRTWSSVKIPIPAGIDPRAVAWQSITQPLCHASSTL